MAGTLLVIWFSKRNGFCSQDSGADYAKFQTWSTKDLKPGPWDSDGRQNYIKEAELTVDQHHELKEYCDKNKIEFLTSLIKDI